MWSDGMIRAQSFRGETKQSRTVTRNGPNGRPVIERLQLGLREYGPTPNPANVDAGLVAVRSQLLAQIEHLSDEERAELVGIGELIIKRPQSLSFDSMSEEVFQDFWQQCCAYLVATDWPTLTEERLTQMADFEAFQEAA